MVIIINFITYFGTALLLTLIFTWLYEGITPYNSFKLIKENNISAVISFGGALIGFVLPLATILIHSQFIEEVVVWGVVAASIQLMVYVLARVFIPELKKNVTENNIAGSLFLAFISLIVGILNAGCMSY
ncbi:DUF350 domain-containing protein [Candidatus Trichorickettsia mobilis]|jgi:putative membrane protein|uniref:DUF350 domain-containing protein n=1 Tax=Candidatus Trichorickettsia mobilis TaxID=1346319 RepID=A0ABZ0UR15_9RICK|nr:DUF350 domain-containing protein [Candidatus Trichorickettsia mobilis]WPY00484.1 DUF350 domain-containing protein [Candidatus Trichorickettsia mobilis]